MKCSNCGSSKVMVESVGNGTSKVSCQECGHGEIRESVGGRRLLTDDMQRVPGGRPPRSLTEG